MGNLTTCSHLQKQRQLAGTDGSKSKDTSKKVGKQEAEKSTWAKELGVYILEKKRENLA